MKARKHVPSAGTVVPEASFNGAAPMKARKPASLEVQEAASTALQWGRADEGAETGKAFGKVVSQAVLQWGRADEGAETYDLPAGVVGTPRFNGAAPMKARKLPF